MPIEPYYEQATWSQSRMNRSDKGINFGIGVYPPPASPHAMSESHIQSPFGLLFWLNLPFLLSHKDIAVR